MIAYTLTGPIVPPMGRYSAMINRTIHVGNSMTTNTRETIFIKTANEDASIAVHRYPGVGPKVLLIHGIGSSSGDFYPVINEMCNFCQPITIDLRGHGASDKPASGYHYSDYMRDLDSVLAKLEMDNPIILGHSLGGIITLMWAAMNPTRPRALIIEDSPLRSGDDFKDAFEGWLQLNALPHEVAKAWYADKNSHWPEAVLEQRSFDMVNTARAAIEELQASSLSNEGLDTFGELDTITTPLLFLQGDSEAGSMVDSDDLATLRQSLPQTRVETFPGAGHTIHRSHPDEWLQTVRQFISSVES